jgi:hypothetical protein
LIIIVTARDEAAAKPRFLRPPYADETYDTDGSAQQPISGMSAHWPYQAGVYIHAAGCSVTAQSPVRA